MPFLYFAESTASVTGSTSRTISGLDAPASGSTAYPKDTVQVVAFTWNGDPGTITVPSGWSIVGAVRNNGSGLYLAVYWRAYTPGDSASAVFSWVNSRTVAFIARAYTGVDPTNPVSSSDFGNGSTTTTHDTMDLTGTGSQVILSFFAHDSTTSSAAVSGFTDTQSITTNAPRLYAAHKEETSGSSWTHNWTTAANRNSVTIGIALKQRADPFVAAYINNSAWNESTATAPTHPSRKSGMLYVGWGRYITANVSFASGGTTWGGQTISSNSGGGSYKVLSSDSDAPATPGDGISSGTWSSFVIGNPPTTPVQNSDSNTASAAATSSATPTLTGLNHPSINIAFGLGGTSTTFAPNVEYKTSGDASYTFSHSSVTNRITAILSIGPNNQNYTASATTGSLQFDISGRLNSTFTASATTGSLNYGTSGLGSVTFNAPANHPAWTGANYLSAVYFSSITLTTFVATATTNLQFAANSVASYVEYKAPAATSNLQYSTTAASYVHFAATATTGSSQYDFTARLNSTFTASAATGNVQFDVNVSGGVRYVATAATSNVRFDFAALLARNYTASPTTRNLQYNTTAAGDFTLTVYHTNDVAFRARAWGYAVAPASYDSGAMATGAGGSTISITNPSPNKPGLILFHPDSSGITVTLPIPGSWRVWRAYDAINSGWWGYYILPDPSTSWSLEMASGTYKFYTRSYNNVQLQPNPAFADANASDTTDNPTGEPADYVAVVAGDTLSAYVVPSGYANTQTQGAQEFVSDKHHLAPMGAVTVADGQHVALVLLQTAVTFHNTTYDSSSFSGGIARGFSFSRSQGAASTNFSGGILRDGGDGIKGVRLLTAGVKAEATTRSKGAEVTTPKGRVDIDE